jgi:hypothetical protein
MNAALDSDEQVCVIRESMGSGRKTESRMRRPRIRRISLTHIRSRKAVWQLLVADVVMLEIQSLNVRGCETPSFETGYSAAARVPAGEIAAE